MGRLMEPWGCVCAQNIINNLPHQTDHAMASKIYMYMYIYIFACHRKKRLLWALRKQLPKDLYANNPVVRRDQTLKVHHTQTCTGGNTHCDQASIGRTGQRCACVTALSTRMTSGVCASTNGLKQHSKVK